MTNYKPYTTVTSNTTTSVLMMKNSLLPTDLKILLLIFNDSFLFNKYSLKNYIKFIILYSFKENNIISIFFLIKLFSYIYILHK